MLSLILFDVFYLLVTLTDSQIYVKCQQTIPGSMARLPNYETRVVLLCDNLGDNGTLKCPSFYHSPNFELLVPFSNSTFC